MGGCPKWRASVFQHFHDYALDLFRKFFSDPEGHGQAEQEQIKEKKTERRDWDKKELEPPLLYRASP